MTHVPPHAGPTPAPTRFHWEPAPHAAGRRSEICDHRGHRLYVRRAAKGAHTFHGLIDGVLIVERETAALAKAALEAVALERFP